MITRRKNNPYYSQSDYDLQKHTVSSQLAGIIFINTGLLVTSVTGISINGEVK
tara:strand:- start:417 stop:575 length:159 start_codon:yes stop_codon:yes gene_type:complete